MKGLERVYGAIVPNPEERWERGGANMERIEIDEGRYADVPFFDLEIAKVEDEKSGAIIGSGGKTVGEYNTFSIKTSDGIDRTARLYVPDDAHMKTDTIIGHADTAWITTITGHNDYAMSKFVEETGLPFVIVGAEHGTNQLPMPYELLRVPATFERSKTISLAKSAQSSQLITSHIRDRYGLSNKIIKTGESRGAMLTPGHFPYAELYGNEIVYGDVTAPCVPKKLLSERADWMRLARWPGSEAMGTLAVGLLLAKKKALKRQMGTVTLNPNFMTSNFVGIGPALFSGEAGRFTEWTPLSAAMYISTFKNDTVSRPGVWRELYEDHDNVYIREHRRGTHMTLACDEVIDSKAVRMNAVTDMLVRGHEPSRRDWDQVFATDYRHDGTSLSEAA